MAASLRGPHLQTNAECASSFFVLVSLTYILHSRARPKDTSTFLFASERRHTWGIAASVLDNYICFVRALLAAHNCFVNNCCRALCLCASCTIGCLLSSIFPSIFLFNLHANTLTKREQMYSFCVCFLPCSFVFKSSSHHARKRLHVETHHISLASRTQTDAFRVFRSAARHFQMEEGKNSRKKY